jgi:hypothetical protein
MRSLCCRSWACAKAPIKALVPSVPRFCLLFMEANVRFPPIRPTTFILPGLGDSCDELGSADSDPLSRLVVVTELAEGTEVAGGRAGPVVTGVASDEEEADKVTTGVFEFNLGGGFKCGT